MTLDDILHPKDIESFEWIGAQLLAGRDLEWGKLCQQLNVLYLGPPDLWSRFDLVPHRSIDSSILEALKREGLISSTIHSNPVQIRNTTVWSWGRNGPAYYQHRRSLGGRDEKLIVEDGQRLISTVIRTAAPHAYDEWEKAYDDLFDGSSAIDYSTIAQRCAGVLENVFATLAADLDIHIEVGDREKTKDLANRIADQLGVRGNVSKRQSKVLASVGFDAAELIDRLRHKRDTATFDDARQVLVFTLVASTEFWNAATSGDDPSTPVRAVSGRDSIRRHPLVP